MERPEVPLFTRKFSLLLVTQTLFGLSFSTFFLLPKFLKQALQGSELDIGRVGALGTVAGVIAFPFVGALNDRFGRRPFVVLGSLLLAGSALAMLGVHEIGALLYGLRMLHGLSFALLFNSATTMVSDDARPERLGQALSVFGASLLVTQAVAPAAAEALALAHGWPPVFVCAGACAALSAVSASMLRDGRVPSPRQAATDHALVSLLARPEIRRVVAVIATAGAGFGTVFTFHQPFALALGIERVSGFFVAYAVSAVATRLGFVTRIPARARLSAVALGVFGYALAVGLTAFLSTGMLIVVGALMGFAQGVFYPLYNAAAVERVAPAQRGSLMALYHGGFNLGVSLALLFGGAVVTAWGFPALFAGMACVVAWGALSLLREARSALAA